MPKIKERQRILDVVKSIDEDEFRLPSIQRSFVWEEERICKLMDSIMNDYPIGSFLVWNPPEDMKVRTRRFVQGSRTGMRLVSEEPAGQSSRYLVLDGQQRLQSLFLGFLGTYDDRSLYFRLDSIPENEENDVRYQFRFMTPDEATEDPHWVRLGEIVNLKIEDIDEYVQRRFDRDEEETKRHIKRNLGIFIRVFNIDEKISFQEVRNDMPYNDVLEVFVRVNSGGIVLTKSDLVFSTLVLAAPEMESRFIELIDELNGRGEFEFDIDFLTKTSFVLFDRGAKYDVKKMEDQQYVSMIQSEFDRFARALTSTLEFLKNDAKILSKRFLKSDLSIIPIVDFVMLQPHEQLTEGQASLLRQYLYMSFFLRFYSYGPDGKLDVIHNYVKKNEAPDVFPIEKIGRYMTDRTGLPYSLERWMLNDVDLVLNIVQGGVSEIPRKRGWSLERDHIFPKSQLTLDIPDELISSVGNLRLINKTRNILKSDAFPDEDAEFFGSEDPELKQSFLKARRDLTKDNFTRFVQKREEMIFDRVRFFLGLAGRSNV